MSEVDGYHPRLADGHLGELLREFPAVMITGPRASGKTTTATNHVDAVVRLDEPGTAATFRADPDAALRRADRPVLLDEWQAVPEVLGAVKRAVDADASPGQIVLTGSVRADLDHETWAGTGRVVRMRMYPVTERELLGPVRPDASMFLDRLARSGIEEIHLPDVVPDIDGYMRAAVRGGLPEVAYRDRSDRAVGIWLSSYLDDLITRDAAALGLRKDPAKLRRYLRVLALNTAGLPTDATLLRAADINAKTAAGYDQLLINLFVLDVVPAWANSRLRRLVKAGKRYLIDSGLAAAAGGLSAGEILDDNDLVGRWFDSFATLQLRPEIAVTHPEPRLHHLRMESGRREVDLVVEVAGSQVVGIEFKAGVAPTAGDAKHLIWLRDELGASFATGVVLHSGPGIYELADRVFAVPLCALWA